MIVSYIYSFAVADIIVEHLPRNMSTSCNLFLHKSGIVSSVVNGPRR